MGGVEECIHPLLNSTLDAGSDTVTCRTLYPFSMRVGGHQTWSGLFGYEKKPVPLPEIETRFLGHPCHYLVTTPTTDSLRAGRSGDRIPVGGEIFPTHPDPDSYTMGIGSFPAEKRPGLGFDHPPTSSAEVKETVEL